MMKAPTTPAEIIHACFAERLRPLGTGSGRENIKKVSRWSHKGRETIVTENPQPNIWLRKSLLDRFDGILPEHKIFRHTAGFHSNVKATEGLKGETMAKFRATDSASATKLANFLLAQIEKHT